MGSRIFLAILAIKLGDTFASMCFVIMADFDDKYFTEPLKLRDEAEKRVQL